MYLSYRSVTEARVAASGSGFDGFAASQSQINTKNPSIEMFVSLDSF